MNNKILEEPLIILDREDVVIALQKHWISNHENLTNPEQFVVDFFAYLQVVRRKADYNSREINKVYNKMLKAYWKEGVKSERPLDMLVEIISRELVGVENILDFGCGKLAFLKELAEGNRKIEKFFGIDSKSHPSLNGLDPRIEFKRGLGGIEKNSIDIAIIKLVLHHLEDDAQIGNIFENIRDILRPGGRMIIFEESFPQSKYQVTESKEYLDQFNLELSEVTEDFLSLSQEDRMQFLFLNDWLMNMQNSYMPWTGHYKSMEQWKSFGTSIGFKEIEAHFLGAIKHRKRKQGMTAYLIWEK